VRVFVRVQVRHAEFRGLHFSDLRHCFGSDFTFVELSR
jgi:hypothetical protein